MAKGTTEKEQLDAKTDRRQLTDKERKRIIATYLNVGTYDETARRTGFCRSTVKKVIAKDEEFAKRYNKQREKEAQELFGLLSVNSKKFAKFVDIYFDILQDEELIKRLARQDLEKVTRIFAINVDKFLLINKFRIDKTDGENNITIQIVRKSNGECDVK